MDTAHSLFEKIVGSNNSEIIVKSAHEIKKHFSNVSRKEPADEIGEELLYLLGGKKETFEWLLLLTILYVNDEKCSGYLSELNSKKSKISIKQSEWAILILSDIKSKMSEIHFDQCSELIDVINKEIEIKKSIEIEEEKKDIILEEESKKIKVSFWDKIVIWFRNKMEVNEMGFLKKLFGKRKNDFNGANSDAQYAYNDAIQKLKQSGIYDEISSISNSKKKNHKEEQDIWIVEWSETVLSNEDMLKLRESLKEAPILSNTTILDKKKQVKDFIEGNLDEVLNRLTDYMQEDCKRPEFIAFRANWVDGKYINVPTWLRRPDGTQTFWPLLILRKSENVFCLLA